MSNPARIERPPFPRGRIRRMAVCVAVAASLIGGLAVATTAFADPPRREEHRAPPPRREDRGRDWGQPGYYNPGYYNGPPVYYAPPPMVYAPPPPPFGLNLMFNVR
jgi:hypothetical protein